MEVGQKVLYNEETYVVTTSVDQTCNIITEEYLAMYNISGVDMRGSTLSTFDAPDGSQVIINTEGIAVGYVGVKEADLTVIEGKVAVDVYTEVPDFT